MRNAFEWLGLVASFAFAAVLNLFPVEWLALGLSVTAIVLSGYAFWKVTRALRQLEEAATRQATTVGEIAEKADAVQHKIHDA